LPFGKEQDSSLFQLIGGCIVLFRVHMEEDVIRTILVGILGNKFVL